MRIRVSEHREVWVASNDLQQFRIAALKQYVPNPASRNLVQVLVISQNHGRPVHAAFLEVELNLLLAQGA